MEINPIINALKDIGERAGTLRLYLDYDGKKERLEEVERELESPSVWDDPDNAQKLGRERAQEKLIQGVLHMIQWHAGQA